MMHGSRRRGLDPGQIRHESTKSNALADPGDAELDEHVRHTTPAGSPATVILRKNARLQSLWA
jgi:hypothetical protein